ncbi:hypothetical protein C2G38_2216680 [Gigaspora rosea]|uniref:Uncharacterized protein n=1 Tax=Gigaspora rosea TaxID=44941 RepID=A0A397U8J4_9GLOM|nr:hypothetical protein C2G38_2216680 [Gigaspora rosea]
MGVLIHMFQKTKPFLMLKQSTKAFAERQREYVDKAKAHNVRNDTYEDDEVVIYETPLLINDNQRQLQFQALDNEVEYNESLIAEREGEIREIEQGFRNTSIRTTIDVSFKAIASTCPNHHEEVYLVGWEGESQPISLSTGTSRGTVPGLRAGCSSNHQYFRESENRTVEYCNHRMEELGTFMPSLTPMVDVRRSHEFGNNLWDTDIYDLLGIYYKRNVDLFKNDFGEHTLGTIYQPFIYILISCDAYAKIIMSILLI